MNAMMPTWMKRLILGAVVSTIPALLTILFLRFILHTDLTQFVPQAPNDQLLYWHSIYSFSQVGFNSGYYVPNELAAAVDFTHFGSVPVFPIVFGTLAHFTGWQTYTGILFNMVLLGAALAFFIYFSKLDLQQIFVIGLFVSVFWSLLFYVPSVFQESLHQSAAIVFAALFYRLLATPVRASRSTLITLWILIVVMSLVRLSWTLLFVPLFIFSIPQKTTSRILFAFVQSAFCIILILVVSRYITSPTNNSVFAGVTSFQNSLTAGLTHLVNRISTNLQTAWSANSSLNVYAIEIWQIIIFLILTLAAVFQFFKPGSPLHGEASAISRRLTLFHLFNIIGIVGASLAVYLVGGYYRVFGAHFLLSLLLLVAFRQFRFVLLVSIINLIALPLFIEAFTVEWKHNFSVDKSSLQELTETFQDYLIYDPAISNSWCNTVLMNIDIYDSRLTAVPAGIGTSFILDWGVQPPLKSKYLLMDEKTYVRYADRLQMDLLTQTIFGDLYLNLNADCYDDLLVYIARNQSPVYLPLDYLNDPKVASLHRGLARFPNVKLYSGQALPTADIIFPNGLDLYAPQFALMQPDVGEIVILPPITYDFAVKLAEEVATTGTVIVNQQGWELAKRLRHDSNLFTNFPTGSSEHALAVFDDKLELVGVEMGREMQVGEWMPVTLYWRLREATNKDYFAYMQLWDFNGNNRSEAQTHSEGLFNIIYPTSKWQIGEIIPETRIIRLYEDTPEGGYQLMLSVFTQPDMQPVTVIDAQLRSVGEWVNVARPVIPLTFPMPGDATTVDAQLGDSIQVTHFKSEPAVYDLTAGTTVNILLFWEAIAVPPEDYIVFVHIHDASGNLVAQHDAPPLGGQYPTGTWLAGERVVTFHTLTIPVEALAPFTLAVGMYTWPDITTLPVIQDGVSMTDNAAKLPRAN